MSPSLLFIVRNYHGRGGMQRFAKDVFRAMEQGSGATTQLCKPGTRSKLSLPSFLFRAVQMGRRTLRNGGRVHLMDPSLVILLPFFRGNEDHISVSAHGLDVIYKNPLYQGILRRWLPRVGRILCISHVTAEEVMLRDVAPEKVIVLPCGIHDVPPPVSPAPDGPRIVTVGRLVERKGVAWFIAEVLPKLLAQCPRLRYHVVGDGPASASIKKVIQDNSLQEAVFLHGELEDDARDALVAHSDIFVMPNVPVMGDMEGFGIACIEASALGVPVIAAELEGLCDAVIEGKTGSFFTSLDALDCANAIISVLRAAPDRAAIAKATKEHFHWSVLTSRYKHALLG